MLVLAGAPALAQDAVLGAGDVIRVQVFGNPDLTLETRVSEGGSISYPLLGDVKVAGMNTATAEKRLAGMLETGGFVRNPQVNVTVVQLQSRQVSVLGAVHRPGRYPLESRRTLVDVLAVAGGINAEGGDTVQVLRTEGGKTTKTMVDLPSMMGAGTLEANSEILPGDVVYVERARKFYIYGEVQRPGVYRLERNMTVIQALTTGGGLTPRGTERGIRIKRRAEDGRVQVINAAHDDLVQPDDVVQVKESLF
ncbi:hypothetical protein NCCP691_25170 [Noviherbaspirillum aridicola]|uniref:Polysaccharide export protein EpsE n=2 Tax=Noviherbaspirillum aridicola TaxID=2849687 RepID=A0ABQ4Q5M8_9BURK|nr:hypothetical protein NCCP691_25170 [Noviherbaspirillum aridicola]